MKFNIGDFVILKEKKVIDDLEYDYSSRVNWDYVNQFRNKLMTVKEVYPNGSISINGSAACWKSDWFESAMENFDIEDLFEI